MKNVNIAPQQEEYDAIVVGSGITGGWAAKELTEKGLKTLVLERGREVTHGDDYVTEHTNPWEMPLNGRGSQKEFERDYPMQSQAGPVNAYNKHWFVKDTEHPYTMADDTDFLWIRGYHLGGRSISWGRQCYRWSDLDFEANARDGIAVDWPIRYADIEPWYDYVEEYVGISGEKLGLPHLPDGPFLPPMEMNCVERMAREEIESAYGGDRHMTIGRTAILTQPHNGRAACHYCGPCSRGCSAGAYFCSLSSTLPAARATGNMTLRCNSIVHSVIFDPETGKASGVRVIDRETKEEMQFNARVVFLCASAMGSTKILLNSTSPRFPNGLANSSGQLGRNIMDHHFKVGAGGTFDGMEDQYYFGNRPNGFYVPRFRNLNGQDADADFIRGYGYQGGGSRGGWGRALQGPGIGADLKERMRTPGPWTMGMTAFGEMLPDENNYCELDTDTVDEWGMPALRFNVSISENARVMREDMATQAAEMLEAAGARNVNTYDASYAPGEGIHEMGTARMGRDPETSVLNEWNQAWDVPNLFMTDGACMTSAACQNPSITYMALTARAVDYAVKEMQRNNL